MNKNKILITASVIALVLSVCLNIHLGYSWNLAEKKILEKEEMNNATLIKFKHTSLFLEGCFKDKKKLRDGLLYCKEIRTELHSSYTNSSNEREECKKLYTACDKELKGLATENERYLTENRQYMDRLNNLTVENERLKNEITQLNLRLYTNTSSDPNTS